MQVATIPNSARSPYFASKQKQSFQLPSTAPDPAQPQFTSFRRILAVVVGLIGLASLAGGGVKTLQNNSPNTSYSLNNAIIGPGGNLQSDIDSTQGYYARRRFFHEYPSAEQASNYAKDMPQLIQDFSAYMEAANQVLAKQPDKASVTTLVEQQLKLLPTDKQAIAKAGLKEFMAKGNEEYPAIYKNTAQALLKSILPDDQINTFVDESYQTLKNIHTEGKNSDNLALAMAVAGLLALISVIEIYPIKKPSASTNPIQQ